MKHHRTSGFTLLEVMVSLAIMAGVILTVLSSVNYHLGIVASERDNTQMTLLARSQLEVLTKEPKKDTGTFAPTYPEFTWETDVLSAEIPAMNLKKLVVRVKRGSNGKEVVLVRYKQ